MKKIKNRSCTSTAGCTWFLGFVGAMVYFIKGASSFGAGAVGLLKALVWPAFLVHKLFEFLKI